MTLPGNSKPTTLTTVWLRLSKSNTISFSKKAGRKAVQLVSDVLTEGLELNENGKWI
jgi:hypothetical protein